MPAKPPTIKRSKPHYHQASAYSDSLYPILQVTSKVYGPVSEIKSTSEEHGLLIRKGVYVVVVFGRTGVGVSSLVNLILGREDAQCHNDGNTCTRVKASYRVVIDGRTVDVFDIPGFQGAIPDDKIARTIIEIHVQRGIDLLVNCLRPKDGLSASNFKAAVTPVHLHNRDIPVVAVVSFLERQKETMEDWWSGPSKNGSKLVDMTFVDHACVTTLPPAETKWGQRRVESERAVRELIVRHCSGARRITR